MDGNPTVSKLTVPGAAEVPPVASVQVVGIAIDRTVALPERMYCMPVGSISST